MASLYLPPGDSVDTHMSFLQELVTKHKGLDVIILGDFNAKSSMWGSLLHKTHICGVDLLDFCVQHDLIIINDAISVTLFQSVRGDSWIDLALERFSRSTLLIS